MRKFFIIFGVLLLLSFGIYQQIRIKRLAKADYAVFNSSRIAGKITKVSNSGGLCFFKVNNADKEYSFAPVPSDSNKNKLFHLTASPGDSIFKMPYSDTLQLKHQEHMYYYMFNEF